MVYNSVGKIYFTKGKMNTKMYWKILQNNLFEFAKILMLDLKHNEHFVQKRLPI